MGKMVYVRENKTKPHAPGWWPKKKRLEVVTSYLALGSMVETARITNVPVSTIENWRREPWWEETIQSIQSGEGQKQDNKMSKVIDKALDLIMERMEQGDYQYDQKTGRLVKIPLKARDLARVASGLFDKRQLIRKQPTNIKASDTNQHEHLLKLAEQFALIATGKKPTEHSTVDEYIENETVVELEDGTYVVKETSDGMQEEGEEGKVND